MPCGARSPGSVPDDDVCVECDDVCVECDDVCVEPVGARRHACDQPACEKTFAYARDLVRHTRTHTGEKPFRCDVPGCDKAYSDASTLHQHRRTHTGEKPFRCDVPDCGYAAAQMGNLTKHKRIHTGEKPFRCDVPGCDKAYSDASTLHQHRRTHTEERPFRCDVPGCGYAAAQMCNLTKHKRIHTGEKPFRCVPGCDKAYSDASNLSGHMRVHHNDTYVARRKVQEQRVCDALVADGWVEWFHTEAMPPPLHFKREKRIDFACVDAADSWCRIDFVLGVDGGGYVFLEVDEHQHRFGYDALLSCDMKRMAKVMASLTVEAGEAVPRVAWLRYNPHTWHVDGALQRRVPKASREAWLCAHLATLTLDAVPLAIGYAFYDTSSDGVLDVVLNDEFHPAFVEVTVDLTAACRDQE